MTDQEYIQELEARVDSLEDQNRELRRREFARAEANQLDHMWDLRDDEDAQMDAARTLWNIRDQQLREEDPDRYSEMKAMGLLR